MFYKWGGSDILSISTFNHYSRILKFVAVILLPKKNGIFLELFPIPYICHFFTRSKFLENKIYTEKRQFFALNL